MGNFAHPTAARLGARDYSQELAGGWSKKWSNSLDASDYSEVMGMNRDAGNIRRAVFANFFFK
ncbi:hypothetical protein A1355_23055 [Methylomonas koyamae]|uniref:Uncharacterized protein n=1 Tax=Methylomonas koyamae TaxID=702114 RepID=A0A177NXJ7_9GAMM|nr:hypothetical protein A1355_23055 [Methylomonas koyamae]